MIKPSPKSSELYIIIYVLLILGAKYLGIDLDNVVTQVQQVAGTYHGTAGNGNQLLVLALAWLGARSGLKIIDIKKRVIDERNNS